MRAAFALLFLLAAAVATRPDVNTVRRDLENRYHSAKTLKAAFFEKYSDSHGGITAESGTVYFSRPGRMRWEYQSPQEKLFLVDGTNAWFYVPADRTASRARMRESADWRTPLALLAGKANLSELCRKLELVATDSRREDSGPAGNSLLRCVPRDNPSENSPAETPLEVLLEVDREAWLVRVVLRQRGTVEIEFRFGNWEKDVEIPEVKFHFQPPPGVAVVDEESLAGAVR